jgi:hypothetical protein
VPLVDIYMSVNAMGANMRWSGTSSAYGKGERVAHTVKPSAMAEPIVFEFHGRLDLIAAFGDTQSQIMRSVDRYRRARKWHPPRDPQRPNYSVNDASSNTMATRAHAGGSSALRPKSKIAHPTTLSP